MAAEIGIIASVIGVAGAGFRLSLILNAVGTEIKHADCNIQNIAKGISLFSLVLKQVGKTMDEAKTIVSQSAIDTAAEIRDQSKVVFDEIKNMLDLAQRTDNNGNIRGIANSERFRSCFKKQKVEYLLGQLESLKLSLSIMLQILQMGKTIAITREDPSKPPISEQIMRQDRAEIQNMIVVQHWSLVELRKLYELAEKEAVEGSSSPSIEDPPPDYDGSRDDQSSYYETQASEKTSECGVRPEIEGAQKKKEDQSNALVKYQEKPLRQLDEQFTLALTRENQALGAPVYDIVNHLLQEWTYIPESESRPSPPNGHRKSYYESDESTSDSEFERAGDIGGRYIQGPRKSVPKNVRFQPRVESDEEEKNQDSQKPRRAPKRHIMHHSETDSSSESELSPAPLPRSRRSSESSNARYPHDYPHEPNDRNRRPYASSRLSTGPEHTISRSASSRGIPPSPMAGRSMPPNNSQQWQGSQPIPAFRPSQYNRPGGPQFMPPSSPYIPAGYSSQHSVGSHFSQQQQQQRPPGTPMAQNAPPPRQHRPHRVESRQSAQKDSAQKDKESASKNLKRGLFGGAAVAGILDLLQGLDGI